jgi:phosphonate metabolism-associated iron-containing alcohol dehydrogenase
VRDAFEWRMPVAVSFGAGCARGLAAALGEREALVMAFAPARALGLADCWSALLGARLIGWVDVPDGLSSIDRLRELAADVWPQLERNPNRVFIAVGGGTTLDLAKVLRCRPQSGGFEGIAAALRGDAPWPELACATLWLLPTTAGTGSEVTRWATVWDTDAQPAAKRSFDEPFGFADRAFVDPLLTQSCPNAVTRDCALDALAHALESIWNRHANPVSDRLAVSAARRVIRALPDCMHKPADVALRSELSLAALEAGLAFSQTRTALAHALSYDVTLAHGVPHGQACAIWLPTVWRLAVGVDARVDRALDEVFAGAVGAARLQAWLQSVGMDARPEAYGIDNAPERIRAALTSQRGRNFVGAMKAGRV